MVNSNLFSRVKSGFKRMVSRPPQLEAIDIYPIIRPGSLVEKSTETISEMGSWPYDDTQTLEPISSGVSLVPQAIHTNEVVPFNVIRSSMPTAISIDPLVIMKRPP